MKINNKPTKVEILFLINKKFSVNKTLGGTPRDWRRSINILILFPRDSTYIVMQIINVKQCFAIIIYLHSVCNYYSNQFPKQITSFFQSKFWKHPSTRWIIIQLIALGCLSFVFWKHNFSISKRIMYLLTEKIRVHWRV